jgi:CheY-like chemotaxis protein
MNRSADDIFAAQIWPWPDPALKRDPYGRVIFVNAAFLQLFGGSVEVWRGQVLQGWNPPQAGPHPNRFEIRTPAGNGYPEQVYDWIEMVGQDGSGLAIARNVTPFVEAQSQAPTPAAAEPVQSEPVQAEPVQVNPVQAEPVHVAPVQTAQPLSAPAQSAPPQVAQPQSAPLQAPPVQTPPVEAASVNVAPSEHSAAPVPDNSTAPAQSPQVAPVASAPHMAMDGSAALAVDTSYVAEAAPAAEISVAPPATSNVHEVNPHAIAADAASQANADRDFERRALPIENDEAVLGSNWRDAVIANAVKDADGGSVLPGLASEPDDTPTPKPDAIRILLAEDNAINALLTRTLLEADGHTVETVEDGALAVEAMKTQQFDMIFMDMRMPNMDGLEATRKIRGLPNVSKDLPIVALTANAFDDDRNACFDSGMNDFMTKPVSAEELSEMVVRWTRRSEEKLAS